MTGLSWLSTAVGVGCAMGVGMAENSVTPGPVRELVMFTLTCPQHGDLEGMFSTRESAQYAYGEHLRYQHPAGSLRFHVWLTCGCGGCYDLPAATRFPVTLRCHYHQTDQLTERWEWRSDDV